MAAPIIEPKVKRDIKPTAGHILVEPVEIDKKTASGIYLPDSSEEKTTKGVVLAVGPDKVMENGTKEKSPAKVGDTVIYKSWGGSELKIDGKEYLFAKFEDILAILKK